MKIVVIGDIHGRDCWEQIVSDNTDANLFIFDGDYLDSLDISINEQILNFNKILEFKKQNTDKVVLLMGNHDYHYLPFVKEKYSGHKFTTQSLISDILNENIQNKNILVAYSYNNFLFTHAGVSLQWLKTLEHFDISMLNNGEELCDLLNDYLIFKPNVYEFTMGRTFSEYGDDTSQTPIWIRHRALKQAGIEEFIHVIGHTHNKDIIINDRFICIDSLPKYIIIENNEVKICEVK